MIDKTFTAILIGNKSDKTREVEYEKGMELKIKYKLHYFFETNMSLEK